MWNSFLLTADSYQVPRLWVAGEQAEEIGNVQEASGGVSGDIDIEYRWEYSTDSVSWIPVFRKQRNIIPATGTDQDHVFIAGMQRRCITMPIRMFQLYGFYLTPENIYIDRKQMSGMINIRSSSPAAGKRERHLQIPVDEI